MTYVSDRSADSSCDTWLAFLVMNSSYVRSHCGGMERSAPTGESRWERFSLFGTSAGVAMALAARSIGLGGEREGLAGVRAPIEAEVEHKGNDLMLNRILASLLTGENRNAKQNGRNDGMSWSKFRWHGSRMCLASLDDASVGQARHGLRLPLCRQTDSD